MQAVKSALISVFHKDGLAPILHQLHAEGVTLYSTGGTQKFIESEGLSCIPVEDVTGFPSILDGRVKTLHPHIFGGILWRRDRNDDAATLEKYGIPSIDMVIVDLYPFEDTVASGASENDIIEKIDIGGIALIRAGAKNHQHVWMVSSRGQYADVLNMLDEQGAYTSLEQRRRFAGEAYQTSQFYDAAIAAWTLGNSSPFPTLAGQRTALRYGENPHQAAWYVGDMAGLFDQLNGKALSYNNLLDLDATLAFCDEGHGATVVIVKHNNACGMACTDSLSKSWDHALEADPQSAFGGVIACNQTVDLATAEKMHSLFYEVLIAPGFDKDALDLLCSKKQRIILQRKEVKRAKHHVRTNLNGFLMQAVDGHSDKLADLKTVTQQSASESEIADLLFASAICRHTKSNTIVLVKDQRLIAAGTGQTSRVDALRQAIEKAKVFGLNLEGAVMASDAFFPFPDCVEIAHEAGIQSVIQPGGSIKDQLSIDYCNAHGVSMVMTGIRHFKH